MGDAEPLDAEKLWEHGDPKSTRMWHFLEAVNSKYKTNLQTYADLHRWSCDNTAAFWGEVWYFLGVRSSQTFSQVVDEKAPMFPRPTFFQDARLNFAENLLFPTEKVDPSSPALLVATEATRETVSWSDLRSRVEQCQASLSALGVQAHDRVAGYIGNNAGAIVAMLAATSLGAIWTAVSPDSGVQMVLDRFKQVSPKVLFTDDSQTYNGKTHDILPKAKEVVEGLAGHGLEAVVVFRTSRPARADKLTGVEPTVYDYDTEFAKLQQAATPMRFAQLPADHPIYILFSSGTTGAPKCITHGAIGTLLQHKKEHVLHGDIRPGDRLMYFTTTTWMMWHWLVSGLASGATLVLYDGSPMRYRYPTTLGVGSEAVDDAMPRLVDELRVTQFGTSAKYLSLLEQKDLRPQDRGVPMPALRAIYNTASPLAPSTFRYVYKAFGPDINLASITGGTDIVSLFGAPCPLAPVYAGEVQVPGLGMAMRAFAADGTDISSRGEPGELVAVRAFPCQPVGFWGADGDGKYRASYFDKFDAGGPPDGKGTVWAHGDFVQFNPRTGGLHMLGRSDGVLNPAGVRFGSAEIYNVLLKHFPNEIADALCVGRKTQAESDETVILFCKMADGYRLDDALKDRIKKAIRGDLTARHVPPVVDECPDIPVTVNGKKIEGAVKQIVSGSTVKTSASVSNPECMKFYEDWAARNNKEIPVR